MDVFNKYIYIILNLLSKVRCNPKKTKLHRECQITLFLLPYKFNQIYLLLLVKLVYQRKELNQLLDNSLLCCYC